MIILLDGRPLVRSSIFEDRLKEIEKRKDSGKPQDRFYDIYTWDSGWRLTAEKEDLEGIDSSEIISPYLQGLNGRFIPPIPNEFSVKGIPFPNHVIKLSSYNSFIPIYQESALEIVEILESRGIDCLVQKGGGAPVHIETAIHLSPGIREYLDKIEEIVL